MNRIKSNDVLVLAVVKGAEQWVFVYREDRASEVIRTAGRFAADPELDFTWYDAARISRAVREQVEEP